MSTDTNKEIVRRVAVEPWEGNLGVIDELIASDYVVHDPALNVPGKGPVEALLAELDSGP